MLAGYPRQVDGWHPGLTNGMANVVIEAKCGDAVEAQPV